MLLKVWPVMLPSPGIETSKPTLLVTFVVGSTLYRFANPVAFAETQNGLLVLEEIPQAFCRWVSVIVAAFTDWSSVTKFVTATWAWPRTAVNSAAVITVSRTITCGKVDSVD